MQLRCANRSIESILGRLLDSLVGNHLALDRHQNVLQSCRLLPVLQQGQIFNAAVPLVYAGQVDFIIEL
jgi:hypothetical protein